MVSRMMLIGEERFRFVNRFLILKLSSYGGKSHSMVLDLCKILFSLFLPCFVALLYKTLIEKVSTLSLITLYMRVCVRVCVCVLSLIHI